MCSVSRTVLRAKRTGETKTAAPICMDAAVFVINASVMGEPLERHARLNLENSWRDEVCAAKGREEVIQSDLIENVNAGESESQLLVLSAKQVVGADTEIEEMTGSNPRRISIVVLLTIGRDAHA